MAKYYASLVEPLLGLYYPLPFEDDTLNRRALQTSKLRNLWGSVYPREEVAQFIHKYGGQRLGDHFISQLDYDLAEEYLKCYDTSV